MVLWKHLENGSRLSMRYGMLDYFTLVPFCSEALSTCNAIKFLKDAPVMLVVID